MHLHILTEEQLGLNPIEARKFLASRSAPEARSIWDYRSLGLTLTSARSKVAAVLGHHVSQPRHPNYRCKVRQDGISDRVKAFFARARVRAANTLRLNNVELASNAFDPDDMLRGWNHGYACRIACQDGLMLLLERQEDVTWQKRSHHWPEKTVRYEATLFSKKADVLKKRGFSRRGRE